MNEITKKIKAKFGTVKHYATLRKLHLVTVRAICAGNIKGKIKGGRAEDTIKQMSKDGVM